MAGRGAVTKSSSNTRTGLLSKNHGEITDPQGGPEREGEKWRKKIQGSNSGADDAKEAGKRRKCYTRFLSLYVRGGGCKVGSCEDFELNRKRSGSVDDCIPHHGLPGVDTTGLECFSNGMSEMFCKRGARKEKEAEQPKPCSAKFSFSLPDDVLELCLVRLPLASIMTSRLVCKKWRYLTTTPHFIQLRSEGMHRTPWLFLFGIVKNGHHADVMHALDVDLDRWHRIEANVLQGRFLFSVATVGTDLYAVGGCSNLSKHGPSTGGSSTKTHRGVLVFSPFTGSWYKSAPMKTARSAPILGAFEIKSDCAALQNKHDHQVFHVQRSRVSRASDVYEGPHRCSGRRQLRDMFNENDSSPESRWIEQEKISKKRIGLIAVGGRGSWDEPLDSGEIYDPASNRWVDIAKLPGDFGFVCTGAVCNGLFYVYSDCDKLAGYSFEMGAWVVIQTTRPPPPRLREYHPKLVSCENRLFMLFVSWSERAGRSRGRDKAIRKLWELHFAPYSWTEVSRHPDAPMDWNAAFVAEGNRIYGVEMFKIFGQVLDFLTVCDVSDVEMTWSRISTKHVAHEIDASSCANKTAVVLRL